MFFHHWLKISYLGAGSYAQVRKIKYKDIIAAVKIFKPGAKDFMKEVTHIYFGKLYCSNLKKKRKFKKIMELRKVDHPNIIKLIASGKWKDKYDTFNCMIIEYAEMGSLHHSNNNLSKNI